MKSARNQPLKNPHAEAALFRARAMQGFLMIAASLSRGTESVTLSGVSPVVRLATSAAPSSVPRSLGLIGVASIRTTTSFPLL